DEVADLTEACTAEERRLLAEKLGVAGLRAIDVRAREHDELRHLELRDVLEELREAGHVPLVVLRGGGPGILHDTEVHDGVDVAAAEDVLQFFAADVDLFVDDVLRLVRKGSAVDADHLPLAMERAREPLAEAAADAGDDDGSHWI